MDFFTGAEVNAVDLVDDVAQQIAADHTVLHASENIGDDFALTTFLSCSCQAAQVCKQAHTATTIGADGYILIDEGQQLIAGNTIFACSPIAPAIRR
ncbi:hypothetical protein D3C85_1734740 [compost metagenome]